MATHRDLVRNVFSGILSTNGRNSKEPKPLLTSTVDRYVNAYFRVHNAIGNDLYDAELLEEYLIEDVQNCKSRRACTTAINHIVRNWTGFSEEQKEAMQALNNRVCEECKSKEVIDESWKGKKTEMLLKYRHIPYKEFLLSLSEGAKKRFDEGGDFNTKRAQLVFAMMACHPPLRNDYCKIVIKDRGPVPEKTPYYHDGKLYFPEGSRIKSGNASPTLDVSECRTLIDEILGEQRSRYLLGYDMAPNTFSHFLLGETHAQLGDKLGMRFFRAKYQTEKSEKIHEVAHDLKVLDHSLPTATTYYAAILPKEDPMAFSC